MKTQEYFPDLEDLTHIIVERINNYTLLPIGSYILIDINGKTTLGIVKEVLGGGINMVIFKNKLILSCMSSNMYLIKSFTDSTIKHTIE
jgi:hypothetical protein